MSILAIQGSYLFPSLDDGCSHRKRAIPTIFDNITVSANDGWKMDSLPKEATNVAKYITTQT